MNNPSLGALAKILCILGGLALTQGAVNAQDEAAVTQFPIGHVSLADDARFDRERAYFMVPVRPSGPSLPGAELGIADGQMAGMAVDVNFTLEHAESPDAAGVVQSISEMVESGIHFVVVDLPASDLLQVSDAVAGMPVTLFNISAPDDTLRAESCRANVAHVIPSTRMQTDAMVQFLVSKRWVNILVLQGPSEEDQQTVDALTESAQLFGARVVEVRPFVLSADPRNREQNNVALVTAGSDYDVLYVADSDGEFARFVPYQTNSARPVVGSAGLVASAWTWAWERSGAPQVNQRFEDIAGRRMDAFDWAAWASVRSVVQSVVRSKSTEYDQVRSYMFGETLTLDGAKGQPMSFRPWDHQLRQGMLVSTGNAVMQLAPVEGFLHPLNDLDTLGVDERQSACNF